MDEVQKKHTAQRNNRHIWSIRWEREREDEMCMSMEDRKTTEQVVSTRANSECEVAEPLTVQRHTSLTECVPANTHTQQCFLFFTLLHMHGTYERVAEGRPSQWMCFKSTEAIRYLFMQCACWANYESFPFVVNRPPIHKSNLLSMPSRFTDKLLCSFTYFVLNERVSFCSPIQFACLTV